MNLLELRTAFVRQCGHMNLVGVQKYNSQTGLPDPNGDDVGPDYSVDNGADFYINKALKYLAHRLKTQGTKQFRRYNTVVGQTVLADVDKIIAISDVRCGQYSGRAVAMSDIVSQNAALTEQMLDGDFQYSVGTLSAVQLIQGNSFIENELWSWPISNAWRFDGTALRGKAKRLSKIVEYEAGAIISFSGSEYICIERNDGETGQFQTTCSFDNGYTYINAGFPYYGQQVPAKALLGVQERQLHYKCSVPVRAALFEWPGLVMAISPVIDAGNALKTSSSVPVKSGSLALRITLPYGPDTVVEDDESVFPWQRAQRQHKNAWGIFLAADDLTLEECEEVSVAVWGIFPATGIYIFPPATGVPVDVEAWFDPAPLIGNYDANWWTDEHADLIIDSAIVELAAVHMNPSGRYLAAQRDQNLSRIIASDTVTTVETLGNRFQ